MLMTELASKGLEQLITEGEHPCACGRLHSAALRYVKIGPGAVRHLAEALRLLSVSRPFVVFDENTLAAAGDRVLSRLGEGGIPHVRFVFDKSPQKMEPDEHAVGALAMAFDPGCDGILAVGSGVINDCCKVLAHACGLPLITVGTAPSMDGYASNSSSMVQRRIKVSLYVKCPDALICDTDIMKEAPGQMLMAGLGDMLAKYISVCEWRISHLVTGEYYCESIAGLMRAAVRRCVAMADGLMRREERAVAAVAEGLVLSGIAMSYAGISRPASGLEHYFSHLWEMMALERGEASDLHGIQVGVGTLLTLFLMEELAKTRPDRQTAERAMRSFRTEVWNEEVRGIFGRTAPSVIEAAGRLGLNDPARHAARLDRILAHWEEILAILREELPDASQLLGKMRALGMPCCPADLGISLEDTRKAFRGSRVIRDKYLTSTLIWDLGLTERFEGMLRERY